jgi:hypothetical protein
MTVSHLLFTPSVVKADLRSNNLTFHKEHVDIFIIKSKTDCYRYGKNVFIAKLPSVAKSDLTISLALVYDSFSFLFLRINVLDFLRNENCHIPGQER